MKKRAFTLIELLVVIAIIALLLSVIIPSLKKAKSHARRIIDRNNLKSLATGAELYATKNDDRYFDQILSATDPLWISKIGNELENVDDVRFCPDTKRKIDEVVQDYNTAAGGKWGTSERPWLFPRSPVPGKKYEMGSYTYNGWLYANADKWAGGASFAFMRKSGVTIPSKTPLFMEGNWVDAGPQNTAELPSIYDYSTGDKNGMGRIVLDRHGTHTNVAFTDNHVETITHAQLWTLAWHKESKPNYNPVLPQPLPKER